jgi:acyl-CoA hydrolase
MSGEVTTASIDNLTFKRGAFLNDIVVLVAKVTYVGNASMEVRVDTYVEEKDGSRHPINRAYLTCVQVDENGKPSRIPYGLKLEKEQQKMEWEGALLRKKNRMERAKMGF